MIDDDLSFSVVIPCRNEADTLAECLGALQEQDYPREKFEIIVVDGGSTDGSRHLARRGGVRVLRDNGEGPSAARNLGIRAARAPIVAFTDADCEPRPDWLTRLAEVFAEDPSLAGVGGGLRLERGTLLGIMEDVDAQMVYRGFITSNAAYRRDVLLEVGGFAEDLQCAEDYDLAWRVMDAGHRVVHDPRPVVVHRPPELHSPLEYYKKQVWYARSDVPTYLRAFRRARAGAKGSAGALLQSTEALRDAFCTATLGGGLAAASPAIAGAGLAGTTLLCAHRTLARLRAAGEPARLLPGILAATTAKTLVRGFGTLLGVADLARPSVRRLVRPPEAVSLAPATRPLPAWQSPRPTWSRA